MTKFGLWYVRWDSYFGKYVPRLKTLNKSSATAVEDFKERFEMAVISTLGGVDSRDTFDYYLKRMGAV